MTQTLSEIISKISRTSIEAKLLDEEDAILAADLMLLLAQRKQLETARRGILTDLYLRMVDVVCHCGRSPTYDAQEIEVMLFTGKEKVQ